MKDFSLKIVLGLVMIIFVSTGCCTMKTDDKNSLPVIKQYFQESGDLRYICIASGVYKIELKKVSLGNVSNWSPCFEGNPPPNSPNRCNENFAIPDWEIKLNKGDQITIWKKENSPTGGETMIKKGEHIKNNILIWQSDHGFTVELNVTKLSD